MAAFSEVKITGYAEATKRIRALEGTLRTKAARAMAKGAAGGFAKEARKRVKKFEKSTTLRKAIVTKWNKQASKRGIERYDTYVTKGRSAKHDGWYAHIIEYGADPHYIGPAGKARLGTKGKALRFIWKGQEVWFPDIKRHPGRRKTPFMRPAFDYHQERASKDAGKTLDKFIAKATKNVP
jgi:HK97 gp10 family phage protein